MSLSTSLVRKAAKLVGVDLPDTRDETLALHAKEHEFIAALRNYRKASKLASTYGVDWLENGYYRDGRIYASWGQLRATIPTCRTSPVAAPSEATSVHPKAASLSSRTIPR